jgi:hypothetical protein
LPTAQQSDADTQDTPERKPAEVFGEVTMVHELPFHRSIRVLLPLALA